MDTVSQFYLFLGLTCAGIGAALVTGKFAYRKAHVVSVMAMLILVVATIVLAYQLGKEWAFPPERHGIHMIFARVGFFSVLGPLITGPMLWKGRPVRKAHRITVFIFVGLTVCALGTGIWSLMGAVPK